MLGFSDELWQDREDVSLQLLPACIDGLQEKPSYALLMAGQAVQPV